MSNLCSLRLSVLAGLAVCAASLLAQQTAAPLNRIVNTVSDRQLVTLKGTVSPLANAQNDRGAAPDSMQLDRLHLYLKRSASQEAALKQLIAEQHTPGSPNYRKWLTPEEFGKRFGPSDQDLATVQSWLAGKGFNVAKVNPGRLTMEISGSVAQMRTAFHTQIHQYAVNGETHYANANDLQIPAALAPVVGGFVSLNNFHARSYSRTLGKASYDPATHRATPQWTYGNNSVSFVLAPADYAVQYNLTPLYNKGIDGTGQTIAIVNESNINVAQVNQFRSLFGLPYNPPQVIVDGNDPGIDGANNPTGPNGASIEAYLDVEWAGAVAPKATVDLVIAADTALSEGLMLAAERAVYSNIAPVISVSFGSCEWNLGTKNQVLSLLWEQAAAQGITVVVSTGDAGSAGCDNDSTESYATGGQAVNGWASTPYNVAVGGTDFYYSNYANTSALNQQLASYWNTASSQLPAASLKQPIPEQPWNDSQFGLNAYNVYTNENNTSIAGTGGGASNCAFGSYDSNGNTTSCSGGYAKPAWQTLNVGGTQYVPNDGVRDLPDVSLFAADGVNYSYYPVCASDGDCQSPSGSNLVQLSGVGGTSASTPAFAAIMALVNQQTGSRQGQANTILYPLKAQFPSAFHDVLNGTNSVPCEYAPSKSSDCIAAPASNTVVLNGVTEGQIGSGSTPLYNAGAGYNLATGLGTVDAYNLVTNWSNVQLAPTATTMTMIPVKTTYNHGDSIVFSGTVAQTGGSTTPSGDVAIMTDSSEPAQQSLGTAALNSGAYSATLTTLPGGTYNVWASYGGDSANAASTSAKTQITVNPETSAIDFYAFAGNSAYGFLGYLKPGAASTSVTYGTQLNLSALVAPSSQAAAYDACIINGTGCQNINFTMPTGTVTFTDNGSTVLNVASVNAQGDAEYNAPFAIGAHAVAASYSGDKSYNAASGSGAINFTVVQDTPGIGVYESALDNAGEVLVGTNQAATVSIQVENGAQVSSSTAGPVAVAAPTGTVTVSGFPAGVPTSVTLSAATDAGTGAVEGVGNLILPASTPSGTYNLTVTYNGDNNYTRGTIQQTVKVLNISSGKPTTTTATLSGSISPTSNVVVSGTVTGQSGSGAPTGDVIVYSSGYTDSNNGNELGSVALTQATSTSSSFSFTLNSATLTQGANFITLQYTGDSTYAPSATVLNAGNAISNPLSDFTLIPASTNLPVSAGASATDTIQIGSVNGFSGTINLTCTAAAGVSCSIGNAGLSSNGSTTATLTVSAPAQTANQSYNVLVTATDAATGKFIHTLGVNAVVSGSTAGAKSFALSAGTASLSLDASASINNSGTSAIVVTPLGGFTGAVALSCAVSPAGSSSPSCSIASPVTLGSAQTATLTVTTNASTTAGSYTVTVTGVSGSISISTPVAVSVGAASFAVSNSGNLTVSSKGTSVTGTITITPSNGFTGTVNLSCVVTGPSGANAPATCGIPSSVSINSSSAQTATLTIYTTAATAMNNQPHLFWKETGGAVLALVLLVGIGRKRRNWLSMVGVLLLFAASAVIGCSSGNSGGNNGGGSSNPGTTSGTYTATVTATYGSGASAITKTTAVTVTVN